MYPDRDFDLEQMLRRYAVPRRDFDCTQALPPHERALTQDLELDTLLARDGGRG